MAERRRWTAVGALAGGLYLAEPASAQVIDDFEAATSPAPWTFYDGAEFPGAQGSLTAGAGRAGQGAVLAYDFTGGGRYVAMTLDLTGAGVRATDTLTVWVRTDPRVRLTFRVTDSTGQTVQFRPRLAFEAVTCTDWCPIVFRSTMPSLDRWGGADDGVLRDDLASFGILVGMTDDVPLTGELGVDDLAVSNVSEVMLDPEAPGQALGPEAEDLFSRWGAAVHDMGDAQSLDMLRDAGFTWVRTDMWWNSVEQQPGVYDFTQWDAELAALESRGMRAIFLLNYGNDLYGGGPPRTQAALDAYGAYAQAAAEYFAGRPVVFELWNEPDGPNFWPPGNQPLEYAALLDLAIDRIRAGDPNASISTGGVSWFFWDFFEAVLGTGAPEGADYFAVHAYGSDPPEDEIAGVIQLRARVAAHMASPPPVIDTEWGFSSFGLGPDGHSPVARTRQAVLAVRSQLVNWVSGMPIAVWYDVKDDCDDPLDNECNFGLLDRMSVDKPAGCAIRALGDVARGRRLSAVLSAPTGPRIVRIEGADDAILAVWLSEPDSQVTLIAPEPLDARDLYGDPLAQPPGDLRFTLNEADGPIYLRYGTDGTPTADGGAGAGGTGSGGTSGAGATGGSAGAGGTVGADAGSGGGSTASGGSGATGAAGSPGSPLPDGGLAGNGNGGAAADGMASGNDGGCACRSGAAATRRAWSSSLLLLGLLGWRRSSHRKRRTRRTLARAARVSRTATGARGRCEPRRSPYSVNR